MIVILDSIRRTVVLALLTAAATTLGTKAIEYAFEKLKEKKPEDDTPKVIIP